MTLGRKQEEFARCFGKLLVWLYARGYRVRIGEVERYPWVASTLKFFGRGIIASLHCKKLAADIHIFRDGKYLTSNEDLESVGLYWESLHPLARWGGRFTRRDVYHFSLEHGGVK